MTTSSLTTGWASSSDVPELAQVLDGTTTSRSSSFARACVDELDRAVAGDEAADLLERPLRRREADPLELLGGQALETLDGEREVSAALRAGDGVHLVEDQRLDRRAASRAPPT